MSGFLGLSNDDWLTLAIQYLDKSRNPDGIKMVTTPEEKEIFKRKMGMMDQLQGRYNFAAGLAGQALQGMSGWAPDIHYQSDYMRGEKPIGGFHLPTFDFSKVGPLPYGNGSTPTDVRGGGDKRARPGSPGGAGLFGDGSGGRDPFAGIASGPGPSTGGGDISGVFQKAAQYVKNHPGLEQKLLQGGGALLFSAIGLPSLFGTKVGQMVYDFIQRMTGRNDGVQDLPLSNRFSDPNLVKPGDPNARQDWSHNQGPGYQDFWASQDRNLRGGFGGDTSYRSYTSYSF